MGSPYMQFTVGRVNVIKSERGFRNLVKEISSIVQFDDLNAGNWFNWCLEEESLAWQYDWDLSLMQLIREDVKQQLWGFAHNADLWHTSLESIIGLIADLRIARFYNLRLVSIIATSYETSETKVLDRCVVIDYSSTASFKK